MTGLPALADLARPVPSHAGARLDATVAAMESLESERRRFARLGLETGAARCHQALKFWRFVNALYTVAEDAGARRPFREVGHGRAR